ncbi:MAG TPA: GNAT family N-acetyltransferase [Terriglobia bacterium]|nr:GNAT family N-acetyltransferase [Terriglobia bacterium]
MAPEIIDIRLLDASDFTPLLQAESRAWSEGLRWDYAPAARVITSCLADRRLSGYALVSAGRVEGYGFYVCEGEKGLIGDFFVPNPYDMGEYTFRLLDHLIEVLLATPGVTRVEAQLPHFSAADLEPRFSTYGFKCYVRQFMAIPLAAHLADREPLAGAALGRFAPEELVLEPWERRYDREAAQFIYQTYRGHIDAAINDQYASVAGATHLIENITELRGCGEPVPRASLVVLHAPTRRLAGLVALTAVAPTTAHIPQIAVGPEFQSRGLGTDLLRLAFRAASERNYREVSLTVTNLNRGAVRFYERLGFETFRTFGAFVWNQK